MVCRNSTHDGGCICGDIRYRIDAICREKDIVIAFPQRDVHLDTVKPLEVRLWDDREKPS